MAGKVKNLLNRDVRYFSRLVIPKDLRPFLENKVELREALGADRRTRKRAPRVTAEMAASIKRLLQEKMMQHDIAARCGINPGRVSEIKSGKIFGDVAPTAGA